MHTADSRSGQSAFSIRVSAPGQRLDLLAAGRPVASYPVSTSRHGLGAEPGSYRTPTGRFVIAEMVGADAPAWAEFRGRRPTGRLGSPDSADDGVLTRILWLAGSEATNANTRDRYIYIHGTNQEALIGTPASHGCVRMRNADVIDLFSRVQPGTPVEIIP